MTMPVLHISLPNTFVYSPRHPITPASAFCSVHCVWGIRPNGVSHLHTRQFAQSRHRWGDRRRRLPHEDTRYRTRWCPRTDITGGTHPIVRPEPIAQQAVPRTSVPLTAGCELSFGIGTAHLYTRNSRRLRQVDGITEALDYSVDGTGGRNTQSTTQVGSSLTEIEYQQPCGTE